MIKCKLLLCAQGVVRDADEGGISIFNILESMQVTGFPFFIQMVDIFALFEKLPGDPSVYDVRFRLSIGETEIASIPLAVDFEGKLRNRSTLHIRGLVIPQPGVLVTTVKNDNQTLGTYEILADLATPPGIQTEQAPAG